MQKRLLPSPKGFIRLKMSMRQKTNYQLLQQFRTNHLDSENWRIDYYIDRSRREGIKMGRPSTYKKELEPYKQQYQKEIGLLKKGISLRNVASITGTSVNTIRKIKELCVDTEK